MSNTNQFPPMAPEMSIRVFVRIARDTSKQKRNWVKRGLADSDYAYKLQLSIDQWMSAARIIKGDSIAHRRALHAKFAK